jgi:hypothetical protein
MNQDQQPRPWWKDTWPVLALVTLAVVIATITGLGYWLRWTWTGLETKSAWDWLELLIIPVALGIGALYFNQQTRKREQELASQERENDRHIAADRAREDAIQSYFDRMSELLLDKNLGESDEDNMEWIVARARTLAVIRSLEGDQRGRKSQVVRFLLESNLIGKIPLDGADLRGANLASANLSGAYLSAANLSGAKGLSSKQLAQASALVGATLPDGTVMTEEAWEEFKKRYWQ